MAAGDGTCADVRNPDEESGPSTEDQVAAAAAGPAAALGPKNTAQPHNAAAAAASAAAPAAAAAAGVSGKRQHSDVDASRVNLHRSTGKKPKQSPGDASDRGSS